MLDCGVVHLDYRRLLQRREQPALPEPVRLLLIRCDQVLQVDRDAFLRGLVVALGRPVAAALVRVGLRFGHGHGLCVHGVYRSGRALPEIEGR